MALLKDMISFWPAVIGHNMGMRNRKKEREKNEIDGEDMYIDGKIWM
jgi:hypothetical protein